MTTPPDFRIDWRFEDHDELASTSDHCIARAEAGEPAGLVVTADRQTRGRGSRGRSWAGASGNLACSLLLRPAAGDGRVAAWPFLAGLALGDALSTATTGSRLTLKWPNDVLLDGRKLGGVLVERSGDWLVIGFGANLAAVPELGARPGSPSAACLAELGPPPVPREVARRVAASVGHWHGVWTRDGFEAIRSAWLHRAHPPGTALAVRIADVQTEGTFVGLDADGALMLRTGLRTVRVDTGEILLLDGR